MDFHLSYVGSTEFLQISNILLFILYFLLETKFLN